jgi:hypothetical protein
MGIKIEKPNPFAAHLGQPVQPYSAKQAVGNVQMTHATKTAGVKHETVLQDKTEVVHPGMMIPPDKLCTITVGGGQTIPDNAYGNVKIHVSLSFPCHKDELNEGYEFASNWVSEKIQEAIGSVKGS